MAFLVHCRAPCEPNLPLVLPPYPPCYPGCGNGGVTPPIDPTIVAVTCPTIPATAVAGAAALLVRVMGQNFTAGCTVLLDGTGQATTFVNATELNFTLTPGAAATTHTIQVDCAGAIATGTCQFTITAAPLMVLTCPLNPISLPITTGPTTVVAKGQNFTATCVGTMDGADLVTAYVNPTTLNLTIDATVETVRQALIGVRDTASGAVSTVNCPFDFTQTTLVPTLTYISPDMVGRYDGGKTVTYTGTNFDATSTIIRGAIGAIPTTFVNATTLTTTTDPATATVAMFEMRVRNGPAGGPFELSNNLQATCTWNPGLNMLSPATAPIAGGPITVQVLGTNFSTNPTAIDVATDTELPTVSQSGGWIDVTLTPPAAAGVQELTVRLGHDHPEGHDNIRPSALNTQYPGPLTLPFTWT